MNQTICSSLESKDYYYWIIIAGLYSLGMIIITNSFLNELVLIPIVFRKINIPVAAWSLIGFYSIVIYYFKKKVKDKSHFIINTIIFGWATHQYLLYVRIFDIVFNCPLGKGYIGYIILLFIFITFLISLWGLYIIENIKYDSFNPFLKFYFLPVALLPCQSFIYFLYKGFYGMGIMTLVSIVLSIIVFKNWFVKQWIELIKKIHSDKRRIVFVLFIVSFVVRFVFSVNVILKTEFADPKVEYSTASDDGPTYDNYGKLLANDFGVLFKDGIITPGPFEPGYSIFLSIIYRIFGHNYFIAGFIQAVLGSIVTVVCFNIAYRLFEHKTALISSYLIALNQPLIFIFGTLNVEVIYIFLIFLSLWILIITDEDNIKYPSVVLFISGLIFGLAIIARGVIGLFPIFILIWMVGKSLSKNKKYLKAFKSFSIFSFGIVVIIISMCYINYLNVGRFILTDKGKAYLAASSAIAPHYDEEISPGNTRFIKKGFNFYEPFELLKQISLQPISFLETYLKIVTIRMKNFFFWPSHGNFDPIKLYLDPNPFIESLEFYAVVMFCVGMILIFYSISVDKIFIFSFVFYYSMLHSTIGFVETVRFRTPAIPFIIIIMSYGISWILNKAPFEENKVITNTTKKPHLIS
jgi:hypothetical protein